MYRWKTRHTHTHTEVESHFYIWSITKSCTMPYKLCKNCTIHELVTFMHKCSSFIIGPFLWNSLPTWMRTLPDVSSFIKKHLKTYLYKQQKSIPSISVNFFLLRGHWNSALYKYVTLLLLLLLLLLSAYKLHPKKMMTFMGFGLPPLTYCVQIITLSFYKELCSGIQTSQVN